MALTDELLSPDEAVAERKKAYDKILNMQPALSAKQGAESSQLVNKSLRDIYSQMQQGGYAGRVGGGQVVDQTQMELAKQKGAQRAEQDALSYQGAQAKEDIIGARQAQSLAQFNRKTQEMEDAMDRAIAERAFDLGMTAKELAFHTNAKVADIGFEELKKDFDAGQESEQELQTVKDNLTQDAQKSALQVKDLLAQIQREATQSAQGITRDRALQLQKQLLAVQKDAIQKQSKAANIAAILSGTFTIGGAAVGGMLGSYFGADIGADIGSGLGKATSGFMNY